MKKMLFRRSPCVDYAEASVRWRMLTYPVNGHRVHPAYAIGVSTRTIAYNKCRVAYVYVGLAYRFAYGCVRLFTVCASFHCFVGLAYGSVLLRRCGVL